MKFWCKFFLIMVMFFSLSIPPPPQTGVILTLIDLIYKWLQTDIYSKLGVTVVFIIVKILV